MPSKGNLQKYTHPETIAFMKNHTFVSKVIPTSPNCGSGNLFFNYANETARKVLRRWIDCAYTQKCFCPKNADKDRWRFDQGSLSVILNDYHIPMIMDYKYHYYPSLRNEGKDTKQIMANLLITLQQIYHIKLDNKYFNTTNISYKNTELMNTKRKLQY